MSNRNQNTYSPLYDTPPQARGRPLNLAQELARGRQTANTTSHNFNSSRLLDQTWPGDEGNFTNSFSETPQPCRGRPLNLSREFARNKSQNTNCPRNIGQTISSANTISPVARGCPLNMAQEADRYRRSGANSAFTRSSITSSHPRLMYAKYSAPTGKLDIECLRSEQAAASTARPCSPLRVSRPIHCPIREAEQIVAKCKRRLLNEGSTSRGQQLDVCGEVNRQQTKSSTCLVQNPCYGSSGRRLDINNLQNYNTQISTGPKGRPFDPLYDIPTCRAGLQTAAKAQRAASCPPPAQYRTNTAVLSQHVGSRSLSPIASPGPTRSSRALKSTSPVGPNRNQYSENNSGISKQFPNATVTSTTADNIKQTVTTATQRTQQPETSKIPISNTINSSDVLNRYLDSEFEQTRSYRILDIPNNNSTIPPPFPSFERPDDSYTSYIKQSSSENFSPKAVSTLKNNTISLQSPTYNEPSSKFYSIDPSYSRTFPTSTQYNNSMLNEPSQNTNRHYPIDSFVDLTNETKYPNEKRNLSIRRSTPAYALQNDTQCRSETKNVSENNRNSPARKVCPLNNSHMRSWQKPQEDMTSYDRGEYENLYTQQGLNSTMLPTSSGKAFRFEDIFEPEENNPTITNTTGTPRDSLFKSIADKLSSTYDFLSSLVANPKEPIRDTTLPDLCNQESSRLNCERTNSEVQSFFSTQCDNSSILPNVRSNTMFGYNAAIPEISASIKECTNAKKCGRVKFDTSDKCRVQDPNRSALYKVQIDTLVNDRYCPGLIQETIDGEENFNTHSFNISLTMSRWASETPNCEDTLPEGPMSLLEAFSVRIEMERSQIYEDIPEGAAVEKIDKTIQDHFANQNPNDLNRSIKSLLLSECIQEHEVEEQAKENSFQADIHKLNTTFPDGFNRQVIYYTGLTKPEDGENVI